LLSSNSNPEALQSRIHFVNAQIPKLEQIMYKIFRITGTL